jgi:hypothetical protein
MNPEGLQQLPFVDISPEWECGGFGGLCQPSFLILKLNHKKKCFRDQKFPYANTAYFMPVCIKSFKYILKSPQI